MATPLDWACQCSNQAIFTPEHDGTDMLLGGLGGSEKAYLALSRSM